MIAGRSGGRIASGGEGMSLAEMNQVDFGIVY
jgi:hypothetical protein